MERANNRTLEQAECAFDAVSMHVSTNVFFRAVLDGFMRRIVIRNSSVGLPLIRHYAGWVRGILADEAVQGFTIISLASRNPEITFALECRKDHCFAIAIITAPNSMRLADRKSV